MLGVQLSGPSEAPDERWFKTAVVPSTVTKVQKILFPLPAVDEQYPWLRV